MTIDCGEGRHSLCIGWGTHSYLIPQLDGERFECRCQCHQPAVINDTVSASAAAIARVEEVMRLR